MNNIIINYIKSWTPFWISSFFIGVSVGCIIHGYIVSGTFALIASASLTYLIYLYDVQPKMQKLKDHVKLKPQD